jgi:hypothetical protein
VSEALWRIFSNPKPLFAFRNSLPFSGCTKLILWGQNNSLSWLSVFNYLIL